MLIFLDDGRKAPKGFITFRTGEELISFLKTNKKSISLISFDHDLGNGFSGYDTIKYLVNKYPYVFDNIKKFIVHSNNFIGRQNILDYLLKAQDFKVINDKMIIDSSFYQYNNGKLYIIK